MRSVGPSVSKRPEPAVITSEESDARNVLAAKIRASGIQATVLLLSSILNSCALVTLPADSGGLHTLRDGGLTFRYPAAWREFRHSVASSFTTSRPGTRPRRGEEIGQKRPDLVGRAVDRDALVGPHGRLPGDGVGGARFKELLQLAVVTRLVAPQ